MTSLTQSASNHRYTLKDSHYYRYFPVANMRVLCCERIILATAVILRIPWSTAAICHNATRYVTKERVHSELMMERCDAFVSACESDSQFICLGQWRVAGGNSVWNVALTNGSGVHYQWAQGESVQVGSQVYEHRYQYVCGANVSREECTDSQKTNWQTTMQLALHVVDFDLQRVNYSSAELNEGEELKLECSTGLPDSKEILTRFEFNSQVSYCRPFQEKIEISNGWLVYREAENNSCILKIAGLTANDSGEYYCSGFLPQDLLEVRSPAVGVFVRSQPSSESDSSGSNIAVIVLSIGLATAALVTLLLVMYFALRRKKNKTRVPVLHAKNVTAALTNENGPGVSAGSLEERSRSISNADDGKIMFLESKRITHTVSQEEDGHTKRLCSSCSDV